MAEEEAERLAEAEAAQCRLSFGLQKSRSLIADYRAKLIEARRPADKRGKPLFRF